MQPYYEDSSVKLYHGDCYEWMADESGGRAFADAVITDPPFGDTSLDWDSAEVAWIGRVGEFIKPSGSVWSFGSLKYILWLLRNAEKHNWRVAQELIWQKQNGSGFHADRFKRVHELIVQLYLGAWADIHKEPQFTHDATARTVRRKKRPTHMGHIEQGAYESQDGGPRLMTSVIYARNCHGYAVHPTQKPIEILLPIIQYSVPVGGLILDPFAGSASTLVAAKLCGRKAIGIDKSEEYCESAAKRLSQGVLDLT